MNNLSGDTVTLSQLVETEERGLHLNRLLFAKFLVMTGRLSEGNPYDGSQAVGNESVLDEASATILAA